MRLSPCQRARRRKMVLFPIRVGRRPLEGLGGTTRASQNTVPPGLPSGQRQGLLPTMRVS
eukprot:scaffold8982_cov125-Isochrysis_galbana.AAC.1